MQGTIAQIVALAILGNAALADESSSFPDTHSTLTFCEFVKFVDLKRDAAGVSETLVAPNPSSWLKRLKDGGVYAIRMAYAPSGGGKLDHNQISDRMLVGFVGGGGRWLLETKRADASDYWEARWEVGDQTRSDRRIWRVTYGRVASGKPSSVIQPDLRELKGRIAGNLTAISSFAHRHNLDGFAKAFDSALVRLNSQTPSSDLYHGDLVTDRLPLQAAQLLAAAQTAWVFGGMGSWNDLGFDGDDQKTYEALSEELYTLLNQAIVASANASAQFGPFAPRNPWWRVWA